LNSTHAIRSNADRSDEGDGVKVSKSSVVLVSSLKMESSHRSIRHKPDVTRTPSFLPFLTLKIPINAESIVDVGCGRGIIGALVRIYRNPSRLVGLDIYREYLNFCNWLNLYDELYEYDLRNIPLPFEEAEFDVATCIEVLEHLPKRQGLALLDDLERIAKMVIVTTPNVSFQQDYYDGNPHQQHLSAWSLEDFKQRQYNVRGLGDLLILGRYIKYLSFFLSRFVYVIPTFAETILAWKSNDQPSYSNQNITRAIKPEKLIPSL